jgi:hypothetical protein
MSHVLQRTVKPMRAPVFSASVVAALLATPSVLADPATPEGAQELSRTAAAYFGKAAIEHGVIAITPQGESYLATIDLQKMSDAFKLPSNMRLTGGSSLVLLTPMADGAWKVSSDDIPAITVEGDDDKAPSFSTRASGFHFDGLFDPKLVAFRSSKGSADSFDLKMHTFIPMTGETRDFALHQGAMSFSTKGVAVGDGAVTIEVEQTINGARESMETTSTPKDGSPPGPTVSLTYDVEPLLSEGSIEGLRAASFGDLWRLLVAHADQADPAPVDFPTALKARILAALPLWDKIAVTATIHDLSLHTVGATAAMKDFTESFSMSGLGTQGSLGFGVKIGDLSVESPLLPAWARSLAPTAVDLDVTLSAAGIDKIVRLAIDEFDGAATPPLSAEIGARMKAMLMSGDPKLTIAHSRLTSPNLDLAFEGALALTPPKPSGKLEVAADGLDKALAVIGKAAESAPGLQKAMLGLTLMKGLAKTDADGKLTWEVALDADGAVSVNGMAMPKK